MDARAGKRLRFIGCEIIYREACALAARSPHRIDLEFLPKKLHDIGSAGMSQRIQERIDAAGDEYEAILLGYARCNNGLVGIRAGSASLVLPRAHDCITFFFGNRRAYRESFDACPGTYYMTTGWMERGDSADAAGPQLPGHDRDGLARTGLHEPYDVLVARYGRENADYIIETMGGWQSHYTRMLYLRMNACDETPFMQAAAEGAARRGWRFETRQGDWTLLEKLFGGAWDDDFLVVPPGGQIVERNDEEIVDVLAGGQTAEDERS